MRTIIHLDADAFFASVEQAADSRLRGKPVAVGGDKRGIIAAASYEARRYGVYTPMPTVRARKLCPRLIVLPGDYEKYEQFSRWMFSYAYDFTPEVEISSIDEGYFDVTGARRPPLKIAETIRQAIRDALKISVSEGIGANKLVSEIASKLHKPAAFAQVPAGQETAFLHPLSNRWLPGIGPRTAQRLNAAGLALIGQIAGTPVELLQLLLGRMGSTIKTFASGRDDRPLIPAGSNAAKSYGHQQTFDTDTTDEPYLEALLCRMADQLMATVRSEGKSIRTLTVKVRYNDMAEDQHSESLAEPTDLETELYGRLRSMLHRAWKRRVSLRLVALKFSRVYDGRFRMELPLERAAREMGVRRCLAGVVDELRRVRGPRVILRGHDFELRRPMREKQLPSRPVGHSPRGTAERRRAAAQPAVVRYIPLNVHSYYSFLNSTLSIAAVIELARRHRLPAIALTDQGNLHGVVEFVQAARKAGIRPILGAEIPVDRKPLQLYVEGARGYHNLCRLLTQDRQAYRAEDLAQGTEGLLAVGTDIRLAAAFPGRFYQAVSSAAALAGLDPGLPGVAMQPVHYAEPDDRWKFDVVQSIRTRTLLRQKHSAKTLGGRFHFRSSAEMAALFHEHPELLDRTWEIAERCRFELPFGKPQFPTFVPPDGVSSRRFLRQLVFAGMRRRYPDRLAAVRRQVEEELGIIAEVGYEDYFLVVWDLLQGCREQGIEWITRGSAADSLVCYCLEISDVCPLRFELYFRRFLNRERMQLNKLPDIDLDFPHDRKDDVIDLMFARYGTLQMAVVGGFSTFKARSAVAEVAKVQGVSEHQIRRFTERFPYASARDLEAMLRGHLECHDLPLQEEPYRSAVQMGQFLDGFPRYPKMHPCGVVLSRQPMLELTPTFVSNKGYPTTHHDMDGVELIGLVKIDILAQGGLAVMRDVRRSLEARGIKIDFRGLEPWEDSAVWDLIAGGGSRAVHHIESPAMVGLCRQCNVRDIDGLIAIVSVIRPGAANEQKKQRFTRRYQGLEPVTYPHPCLESCLRSTYGQVVYEEHILQICERFAGLSPGRADVLRRALNKRKQAVIDEIGEEFHGAARKRGHPEPTIAEVWGLVSGFAGYAFCKAHSTAYGVEAYQSAWLKRYYPVEFMAAVLTHGKGFYHPLVYVLECHRLGIPLLPPRVNEPGPEFVVCREPEDCGREPHSARMRAATDRYGATLSEAPEVARTGEEQRRYPPARDSVPAALREELVPFRRVEFCQSTGPNAIRAPVTRVKGLTERTKEVLLKERARAPFRSLSDCYRRVLPRPEEMEALIRVGAFDGFGQARTAQFWEYQILYRTFGQTARDGQAWLLPPPGTDRLPEVPLREPGRRERLEWETDLLDFCVSGHPLELYDDIAWETYCPVARLGEHLGKQVVTCGLVIEQRIHHQVTGEPMKFLTLADWTGIVETELFASTYRSYGLATVRYPVLEVTATVEPFENQRGFSLRVHRAGKPRLQSSNPL